MQNCPGKNGKAKTALYLYSTGHNSQLLGNHGLFLMTRNIRRFFHEDEDGEGSLFCSENTTIYLTPSSVIRQCLLFRLELEA